MQKYCKAIGALVAASALAAGTASAEVEYSIYGGFNSDYIFRGYSNGVDLTEAGLSAATSYAGFDITAGVWYGSWQQGAANFDEVDYTLDVSRDLGFATASIGYIFYHFPNDGGGVFEESADLYFTLSKELFGINTAVKYFWEVEDAGSGHGGYLEFAAGKDYEINSCLTLTTSSILGYLIEENTLSHAQVKLGLAWAFTETATLTPYIAHSWALTEDSFWAASKNELFAGAVLSVSF